MRALAFCLLLAALGLTAAAAQLPFQPIIPTDLQAARASSSNPDPDGNGDSWGFKPGETRTLADLKGPGEISHIWCTISSDEPAIYRKLVLRMYWDGEQTPSVECPIGDFFGLGQGQYYLYDCAVFSVGDRQGFNCYWPMPFARSARITVTNEAEKGTGLYFYVDYLRQAKADPRRGRFHAQYRQFSPPPQGRDMTILEARGRGIYVGCHYTIYAQTADWWGEGDDKFYIDDQGLTLKGTGTEDYFCGGWGFPSEDRYAHLYTGVPLNGKCRERAITNCYRYHLADPIPFAKSLRFDMEHKGAGMVNGENKGYLERFDIVSTVAYWYQHEPHAPFPALPAMADRLLDYQKTAYKEPDAADLELYVAFVTVEGAPASALGVERMIGYGGQWSNGEQALLKASGPGARLVFPSQPLAGLKGVVFFFTQGPSYGNLAIKQGDEVLATWEGYAPQVRRGAPLTVELRKPIMDFPLVVEVTGKAEASSDYWLGIDCVKMLPAQ